MLCQPLRAYQGQACNLRPSEPIKDQPPLTAYQLQSYNVSLWDPIEDLPAISNISSYSLSRTSLKCQPSQSNKDLPVMQLCCYCFCSVAVATALLLLLLVLCSYTAFMLCCYFCGSFSVATADALSYQQLLLCWCWALLLLLLLLPLLVFYWIIGCVFVVGVVIRCFCEPFLP